MGVVLVVLLVVVIRTNPAVMLLLSSQRPREPIQNNVAFTGCKDQGPGLQAGGESPDEVLEYLEGRDEVRAGLPS